METKFVTEFDPYQDIIINGKIVQKGIRQCSERLPHIEELCNEFKRPFTLLDIGCAFGYFVFSLAPKFPDSTFVMIEGGEVEAKYLKQLCKLNNVNNVIFLNKHITPDDLIEIGNVEHFDIVLALNIVHHFDRGILEMMNIFNNIGEHVIMEFPVKGENSCNQEAINNFNFDLIEENGGKLIAKTSSHVGAIKRPMYYFYNKKENINSPYWKNSPSSFERPIIESDLVNKTIEIKRKNFKDNFIHGINLFTFFNLNGVFPEKEIIVEQLQNINVDDYADVRLWNFIISGKNIHAIDKIDNNTANKNLSNKYKNEIINCINTNSDNIKNIEYWSNLLFKPKCSVCTITVRYGGLDWQAEMLARQTFKEFEWLIVDALYHERKEEVKKLAHEKGLHIIHLPEPKLGYKTVPNRTSNWNELLKYIDTPYTICLEDWHIIPDNFIEKHYHYLSNGIDSIAFRWVRTNYMAYHDSYESFFEKATLANLQDNSISESDKFDVRALNILKSLNTDDKAFNGRIFLIPPSWWWPNTLSIKTEFLIKVGGFDQTFDGGTGGEDVDIANRLSKLGIKFFYDPSIITFHINHGGDRLPSIKRDWVCENSKLDRAPFTYNEYTKGDPNLMENDNFSAVLGEDGIRYLYSKHCEWVGIIDSGEIIKRNMQRDSFLPLHVAPWLKDINTQENIEKFRKNRYNHNLYCLECNK
jgi:hypothetical protein